MNSSIETAVESTDGAAKLQRPLLVQFLDELVARGGADGAFTDPLAQARDALASDLGGEGRPFLTVLLRTQGKRIESLKDALLCLTAQSDQDFEIVVLDHDAAPDDALEVRRIVASQSAPIAAKTRIVEVAGGNRARPLNAGVREARGSYIAVYDDDDLLFGNWVEEFRRAALSSPGRLLRSVTATQSVEPEMWPLDQAGYRTTSWPKAEYAPKFVQLDHLTVNHSPFMSWAFPRSLFTVVGLRFDEELTVCEDWDLILQGSLLLGVTSIDSLTAIYRRWVGGHSSYTQHSRDSWIWSEKRVVARLNDSALLVPAGTVDAIRGGSDDPGSMRHLADRVNGLTAELSAIHGSRSWKLIALGRHVFARPRRVLVRAVRFVRAR